MHIKQYITILYFEEKKELQHFTKYGLPTSYFIILNIVIESFVFN